MDPAPAPSAVVEFGRFTFDRYRDEFRADGRFVDLAAGVRSVRSDAGAAPRDDDGGYRESGAVAKGPSADVQGELRLGETR